MKSGSIPDPANNYFIKQCFSIMETKALIKLLRQIRDTLKPLYNDRVNEYNADKIAFNKKYDQTSAFYFLKGYRRLPLIKEVISHSNIKPLQLKKWCNKYYVLPKLEKKNNESWDYLGLDMSRLDNYDIVWYNLKSKIWLKKARRDSVVYITADMLNKLASVDIDSWDVDKKYKIIYKFFDKKIWVKNMINQIKNTS